MIPQDIAKPEAKMLVQIQPAQPFYFSRGAIFGV